MMIRPQTKLPIVTVNVFPGGFNWGIYVGQDKQFFEAQGISVDVMATPNSICQMTDLADGKCDIAMTAVDNIVAYSEGQGEASIGPQPDFFAFMGSDSGFLNLVAQPSIRKITDLAGCTVSVDAFTTGYAFVLYEILRRNGLDKDSGDYKVVSAGGMVQRWKALSEGKQDATLLSAPYNIMAQEAWFISLGRAVDILGTYQGNVAAARKGWAKQNSEQIVAFIRAYRDSIAWLYKPTNRAEAIEILRRNLPNFSPKVAEAAYRELLDPQYGFFKNCDINIAGVQNVLALRKSNFPHAGNLSDPAKYCNFSFAEMAKRA
jgi:ABC-type nitrate/sulfonate/bicarbonate transport system substrate-binding protein